MRIQLTKTVFAASICFAITFTLSCSSDKGGGSVKLSPCSGGTVAIGTQTWQKCNLNIEPAGTNVATNSWCYDDNPDNCAKYGRLYDWATAMALPASCNSNSCANLIQPKHKGICPAGFHIPTNSDWDILFKFVDSQNKGDGKNSDCSGDTCYDSKTAGKYLKASNGWSYDDYHGQSGNGSDKYGFSAIPGGFYDYGNFNLVSGVGYWWSISEYNSDDAYYRNIFYGNVGAYWNYDSKEVGYSVRCLQD